MKIKYNLILTLAVMLTMAQTAWAATKTETRTVTFYMDGGASGRTSKVDDWTLNSGGITLHYYQFGGNREKRGTHEYGILQQYANVCGQGQERQFNAPACCRECQ